MNEQQFQLTVSKGPQPGKVIELTSESMTIGRDPMSEIMINDPEVSRRHAILAATPSGYQIQDLGSTNGTFVDGLRLGGEPVDLRPGQVITIGGGVGLVYEASATVDEPSSTMLGEQEETMLVPPKITEEPELVADELAGDEVHDATTLFSEEDEIDHSDVDEVEMNDLGDQASEDSFTSASTPEAPVDEENFTEDADKAESYEASEFSDPVVIPHDGEPAPAEPSNEGSNYRRLSIIVASVLLVLVCCCCGFLLFFYYVGGDWLLRQMGLLP